MMKIYGERLKLFHLWYLKLRERRHEFCFPWYYHTSYNVWNCIRWAWYNSDHNDIDESYLWTYSLDGKTRKRKVKHD